MLIDPVDDDGQVGSMEVHVDELKVFGEDGRLSDMSRGQSGAFQYAHTTNAQRPPGQAKAPAEPTRYRKRSLIFGRLRVCPYLFALLDDWAPVRCTPLRELPRMDQYGIHIDLGSTTRRLPISVSDVKYRCTQLIRDGCAQHLQHHIADTFLEDEFREVS